MASMVLVHGAWHGAWCWDGVVDHLDAAGIDATAVELPHAGFAADVAMARDVSNAADVGSVVIAHSYGGSVITEATAGMTDLNRLVYLAAFMTDTGVDMVDVLGGHDAPLLGAVGFDDGQVTLDSGRTRELLYADSDNEAAAAATARLREMIEWPTDHSPFLTHPHQITNLLASYLS